MIFKPITEKESIKRFVEHIKKQGAYLNSDGTWSCDSSIDISNMDLISIPVQFKEVIGDFNCSFNNLTTLKGCPEIVNGNFYCRYNQLNSLKYCPIVNSSRRFYFGNLFNRIWNGKK